MYITMLHNLCHNVSCNMLRSSMSLSHVVHNLCHNMSCTIIHNICLYVCRLCMSHERDMWQERDTRETHKWRDHVAHIKGFLCERDTDERIMYKSKGFCALGFWLSCFDCHVTHVRESCHTSESWHLSLVTDLKKYLKVWLLGNSVAAER